MSDSPLPGSPGAPLPGVGIRAALILFLLALHAPLFLWLARIWWELGMAVASLSILISPVIAGLLYLRRRDLGPLRRPRALAQPQGLWMMGAGALLALVAALLELRFLQGISLPLCVHGYLVWTRGHEASRPAVMPTWLLVFLVPWSYGKISQLSEPLQVASAQIGTWILQVAGYPSVLQGTVIHTGITTNHVNESCSGIATLSALVLYGLVFAYIFRLRPRHALWITVALLPTALLANGARVAFISYLLYEYGEEVANGPMHNGSGHVLFALTYASLFLVMRLLKKREKAQMAAATTTQERPSTL